MLYSYQHSEHEIGLVCWEGQTGLSLSHKHGRVAAPGPSFLNWWGWTHAEVKLAFVQRLGSGCGRLKVMDGCRARSTGLKSPQQGV